MSRQPLISVVVPVYNAEQFLHQCVDSLLAQTYENLEIILVDDGATDASPAICDDYAKRDARARVLHTKNSGVSAARNLGVKNAAGKFIAFMDADDYAGPELIQHLYEALTAYDADLAIGGVRYVDAQGATLPPVLERVRALMEPAQALSAMLYQTLFFTSPWGKLLPAALARAYPFPEGRRYEDMATVYLWLANAPRIAVDTVANYNYVQHAGSFMGRAFTPERFTQLNVSDDVYDYIAAHFPAVLPAARARRFAAYCQVLLAMPADRLLFADERARMLPVMRADAPSVARDAKCRKKDRLAAIVFRLSGERGLRLLWRAVKGS